LATIENRPTLGGILLQHGIVFLICVVFPGLVTWMVPATWITFNRNEAGVRCKTHTCVYFVIPFQIQQVDQVTGISQRERSGRSEKQRRFGRTTNKTVEVQGEGFLLVQGVGDQALEVSVSPASLASVVGKSNQFLASNQPSSTTIFAIANWKFGGIMGGVLTLFTLLYAVGYTLGFLKWLLSAVTSPFTHTETQ
jgi:hypothetical protein